MSRDRSSYFPGPAQACAALAVFALVAACASAGPGEPDGAPGTRADAAAGGDTGAGCTPASCDDGDACTVDTCDVDGDCSHEALVCDDGETCTTDTCDSATGCVFTGPEVMGDGCPAGTIDVSAGGSFTGDSYCAVDDTGGACGGTGGPDVQFAFAITEISDVTIDSIGTMFDAVLLLGTSCGGEELGCDDDSGGGTDALISANALMPGTYFVALDGKTGTTGGPWTLNVAIAPAALEETVVFPNAGDTLSPTHGYLWELGAYVEGTRSTSKASTTSVDIHLVFDENVLDCDNQDMRMLINGTEVGTFVVTPGTFTIDQTYSFAAITGTTYTLRYENTRQVAGGCGSARPDMTGVSTVTLR